MADELEMTAQAPAELINNVWDSNPTAMTATNVETEKKEEEKLAEEKKIETENKTTDFSPDAWVKENFNYENVEAAKQDFEALKKLREKGSTPETINFENEESEKLFKYIKEGKEDAVYDMLHKKRELQNISNNPLEKVEDAISVLRTNLRYQNPDFSVQDIDDIIEDKYALPEKPNELDDDYDVKLTSWNDRIAKVNRAIIRDAKVAKSQMASAISTTVLPDIDYTNPKVIEERQRVEAENQKLKELFETTVNADYKNFSGYNVAYKSEDGVVDVSVQYVPSDSEKDAYKSGVLELNPDSYFGERWFDETGKPKVAEMISDKYFLENRDRILQKLVTDTAEKVRDIYIKSQKNINLNSITSREGSLTPSIVNDNQKLQQNAWAL